MAAEKPRQIMRVHVEVLPDTPPVRVNESWVPPVYRWLASQK